MPWKFIGNDETGYVEKFVDEGGSIIDGAEKTFIRSEDSWGEYFTPATVDKRGFILKRGSK